LIFKNDKQEDKQYSLVSNGMGMFTLREFANKSKKTELTLSSEECILFKNRLKDNGWYEYIR